jgi:predicted heme/steroid binding protein
MARYDDKCGVKKIAYNVPAVYDVFASPIKETEGFQGLQKCGLSVAWEWSVAQ